LAVESRLMIEGRLALLVLLYVALDFSSPLIPGAVSFDADASVEGVRRSSAPVEAIAAAPGPEPTGQPVESDAALAALPDVPRRQPAGWRPTMARPHLSSTSAPGGAEDG
jgi:hypothetical protein